VPGGSPGFDPYMQLGAFPTPQPYYAAPPQQPRPAPRPVAQQPRPQPSRPASVALPPLETVASKPVELPPPEVLGIRLDDPLVTIPAPEKLGIKLD
jgi:hypothetical protein